MTPALLVPPDLLFGMALLFWLGGLLFFNTCVEAVRSIIREIETRRQRDE